MKKAWLVIVTICMVALCGCETQEDKGKTELLPFHGMANFEIVEKSVDCDTAIIRDKKANVLYLVIGYKYKTTSITPLYNADGSLRTYEQK